MSNAPYIMIHTSTPMIQNSQTCVQVLALRVLLRSAACLLRLHQLQCAVAHDVGWVRPQRRLQ